MTLRGKDYCNCDHAQMLREAIEAAVLDLSTKMTEGAGDALCGLRRALKEDHAACLDLWGDLKESRSTL